MIRIKIWGSRGSLPVCGESYKRHGGATTCIEIQRMDESDQQWKDRVVLDCGSGLEALGRTLVDQPVEVLILQSHYHWDHIQGFPFFKPIYLPHNRFHLWGVVRDDLSFREVLGGQMKRPYFPVGLEILDSRLSFQDLEPAGQAHYGPYRIAWTEMFHPSGSTAFRIEYKGRKIVYSGDVEVQMGAKQSLIEFAQGADVLIMDSQYFAEEYEKTRGYGHSTIDDATEVAMRAEVRQLIMGHHDPSHDDTRLDQKLEWAQHKVGQWIHVLNAKDGLIIDLD